MTVQQLDKKSLVIKSLNFVFNMTLESCCSLTCMSKPIGVPSEAAIGVQRLKNNTCLTAESSHEPCPSFFEVHFHGR